MQQVSGKERQLAQGHDMGDNKCSLTQALRSAKSSTPDLERKVSSKNTCERPEEWLAGPVLTTPDTTRNRDR
jgi:hypothetical protein